MVSQPIPFRVTRYRCPHCPRTGSSKALVTEHIGRCWLNPAARGCKTCVNYLEPAEACGCEPGCNWGGPEGGYPERCAAGISLAGREACERCGGANVLPTGEIFRPRLAKAGPVYARCEACGGDGGAVKPGPIVHCHEWQPRPPDDE